MSEPSALDSLARVLGDALTPLADRLQGDQALETLAGIRPSDAIHVTIMPELN